jgi:hypothetical protein
MRLYLPLCPDGYGKNDTVEHFVPKSVNHEFAYEWSTFRFSFAARMNSRKGIKNVLDPFLTPVGLFYLNFPALLLNVNSTGFPDAIVSLANGTMAALSLNDERCVMARSHQLVPYCRQEITFAHLARMAPFMAMELQRQGLMTQIRQVYRPLPP